MVLTQLAWRLSDSTIRSIKDQHAREELLRALSETTAQLKVAHADAVEANDAKSRFLAQASHDLRQPLHAINLFIEALSDTRDPGERAAILDRVRQSLDVLTNLFDSLLDVTLLDTGGISVAPQPCQPSRIYEEVIHDFAGVAAACNVRMRAVPSAVWVDTDPVLLRRLLQNLVSNAIRYSEGGTVLIGCRRRGAHVDIWVVDSGAGINPADQARIFQEFTRLEPNRTGAQATPGMGLGLSIVKRITHEMGIDVSVRSTAGRGSTFSLGGFPVAEELPERSVTSSRDQQMESPDTARILIIDDDQETLDASRLLLQRWGYAVEVTPDWHSIFDRSFDVVICDYELAPGQNGLDLLSRYREQSERHTPSILISGNSSEALRNRADADGIPVLNKPVRPAQLKSALLHALS